jgi:hypothetical protein
MEEFLIKEETTYQEIVDYLLKNDPSGVSDLVYILLTDKSSLITEVKSWSLFK